MLMNQLLYIEDNKEIALPIKAMLEKLGYHIIWKEDGESALLHIEEVDLVILDIMLPGLDGFSIGKRLKKLASDVPIFIVSARTSLDDKIEGLAFADDYITKPFHPEELAARIEVLLRRFQRHNQNVLTIHHLKVNLDTQQIINQETTQEVLLTGKQFQIFYYFLQHLNQILTKEQIYEAVWKEAYIEGDKTLMVHIRYLREKLEQNPAKPLIIETIRGVGYRVKGA
jgi:DNA-binding response OmpR family regulator